MKDINALVKVKISYSINVPCASLPKVECSRDAYDIFESQWSQNRGYKEEFYCMFLNRSNRVLGIHKLSSGGSSSCVVDVKLMVQLAINTHSQGVIVAHNHPSGNLKSSISDQKLTTKLRLALGYFDISLLDHLILDDGFGYLSMADNNEL